MISTPDAGAAPGGRLALALSGGGSRAIAFHLGCLRALHKAGILDRVTTISSVSGGSVLAALYCTEPGDFDAFDRKVRAVLAQGLIAPALRTSITTLQGVNAFVAAAALATDRALAFVARQAIAMLTLARPRGYGWMTQSSIRRWASRTTILRRVFEELFQNRTLVDLRADRPKLIVVATELRAKAAFYFSADASGCWRYGTVDSSALTVAHAVTASAAYPAFLPALDETLNFSKGDIASSHRVCLTDGGVYDNLGLSPLWPDRKPEISLNVDRYDRIICCRAGYGLSIASPTHFWPSRMYASVDSLFERTQNAGLARLFDLWRGGKIRQILLPYLGQEDARLKFPPDELIRREDIVDYPTNFSSMSVEWIDRLVLRGEQITRALLQEHGWQTEPDATGP